MDSTLLILMLLGAIAILTLIFEKVVGPKILDWISPMFDRVTGRIDEIIMGKSTEWESKVREILEAPPAQLKARVAEVVQRFGKSGTSNLELLEAAGQAIPPEIRGFFERYTQLSFNGYTYVLDVTALRVISDKNQTNYLVIGRCEDEGHFYALNLREKSVVILETDEKGKIFAIEEDAPSFDHFILLQYELHMKDAA